MENNGQTQQSDLQEVIDKEVLRNGGEWSLDPNCEGAQGTTMFDLPNSEDNLISVLISKDNIKSI